MDSIVEQQRQACEDIERLEQAIVDLMMQSLTKHRYKLIREQKINALLDQIQARSKLVADLQNDVSGLRKPEVEGMAKNKFNEFYARLGDIRDFHRRNPDTAVFLPEIEYLKYKGNPEEADEKDKAREARLSAMAAAAAEGTGAGSGGSRHDSDYLQALDGQYEVRELTFVEGGDEEKLDAMFSGEERFGRYVDLHEQHELYLNIKDAKQITYLEYLGEFQRFEQYPRKNKLLQQYTAYAASLSEYFVGYFSRAMPLFDLPKVQREAEEKFAAEWEKRAVAGWETQAEANAKDMFCAACKRQFEKETTFNAHISSRKHKKTVARLESERGGIDSAAAEKARRQEIEQKDAKEKDVARIESLVRTYAQVLADKIHDTRANVERRQALTEEERNQEIEDDELEVAEENDDDKDEQIYNPLNLPLGWDGKPIPYWLYKLHGLGVKYVCEICGNATYRGRKAYEKHFQEARHATNMRRLGIPNTRQFHGVAKIDEALALWERIQKEKKSAVTNADTFEEYEDSEGNVFNKKTYFDLKRQGLI
ncbi:Pre-mRNA-splicing factor sap61 [Dipsacomyces acuminosporus]|nr:Pre-mRNA-splicing factor sap61 [Dipsacomyces acuminosporus]